MGGGRVDVPLAGGLDHRGGERDDGVLLLRDFPGVRESELSKYRIKLQFNIDIART